STLDVLMFGLVIVAIFEVLLGGLRTYVFSQTTNKIDVELGARLFDHLLALPMAYFGSRRVGDSVARVRELENIRNFITGSALTRGNITSQVVKFINKTTIVLTLYFGAKAVIASDMTVGELVAFNMLAARVGQPVLRIAQLWQDFQQTRISVARLGDILNTPR